MNTTSSVSEILTNTNKIRTTGLNKLTKPSSYKTTDLVIVEVGDLINPAYRKWHCRMAYKIGRIRYLQLAAVARADGNNPAQLFTHLLRKEKS